jgi:hypothetical protein
MSVEEDDEKGIVPTLEVILQELQDAQQRVKKFLASARRVRTDDTEVAAALRKVRRELVVVKGGLEEVISTP